MMRLMVIFLVCFCAFGASKLLRSDGRFKLDANPMVLHAKRPPTNPELKPCLPRRSWPHSLMKLPYAADELEPHISEETVAFHYGKHHAAYVDNLNDIACREKWARSPLEDIIIDARSSKDMFNNAAQIWNHNFYWRSLSPTGGGEPKGWLAQLIDEGFGNFTNFKLQFTKAGLRHFGSGWIWLCKNEPFRERHDIGAKVVIVETHDAHVPTKDGLSPLLVMDVWEHAYYIDRRNSRRDYIQSFFELANWDFAEANLMALRSSRLASWGEQLENVLGKVYQKQIVPNYTRLFDNNYV